MATLFDGQGNAVEAFTQEEVDKMFAEHPELKNLGIPLTQVLLPVVVAFGL